MKKTRFLFSLLLVSVLLCSLLFVASCSDEGELETGISSVEIKDKTKITLKATLDESYAEAHSKDTLYILAISEMQPDGSLNGASVVAESKARAKMTFEFSLTDDNGESRVAHAFVLAEKNGEKYSALTDLAYVSNPDSLAQGNNSPESTSGIKGICTDDVFGASVLGAEHILVEAKMDKLILEDYSSDAIRFNFGNLTYFYDSEEVERLDKLIKEAELVGARVYIRTTLAYNAAQENKTAPDFLYVSRKDGAEGCLPDLSDARAVRYVKAFYAFLASRYSACDYVIGEQVNDYSEYCQAGKLSEEEFEKMYSFWARISNQVLKSVNSNAKIYVPISSSWKAGNNSGIIGGQVFLSHFADNAKKGGDYDYAVAVNLGNGHDLPELLKGEAGNYSKIGATNLSSLSDFIDKSEMRYKSERRDMIIDGLSLGGDVSGKNRAAYYTYTYYSAAELGFDAFIYSDSVYGNEYSRADLYFAFLMCGSSMNSQLSDYTDRLEDAYVPDFDEYITNNLKYVQSAKTEITEQAQKNKKPFPISLPYFEYIGGVSNYQGKMNEDGPLWVLEADLDDVTGGICASGISAEDLLSSGYVGITLGAAENHTLSLLIQNEGAERRTFIGECRTDNGEKTYYFDISDFTKDLKSSDTLTLAICLLPDGDSDATVEIKEVALYGASATVTETVIVVIVVAVVVAALVGSIVLLAVKRKKKHTSDELDD